jgi:hypothetical protein
MFRYYYHGSIRKLVVAFGSLFNEIYISRKEADGTEQKKIKVPISYGPKEKFVRKIKELDEADPARKSFENILPRMSFEISSMVYDTNRKLNSHNKVYSVRDENDGTISYAYSEVPYNIEFTLNIMNRNIDDGYQIIEQILPYFTPDFTISMNFTELDRKMDVPVILSSVNSVEDYEGDLNERRLITHSLIFQTKSYIFGPIRTSGVIREIDLTFRELTDE